jgi:hypothetical protein
MQADQSAFDAEQLAAPMVMPIELAGAEPEFVAGLVAAPDGDGRWSVDEVMAPCLFRTAPAWPVLIILRPDVVNGFGAPGLSPHAGQRTVWR